MVKMHVVTFNKDMALFVLGYSLGKLYFSVEFYNTRFLLVSRFSNSHG